LTDANQTSTYRPCIKQSSTLAVDLPTSGNLLTPVHFLLILINIIHITVIRYV